MFQVGDLIEVYNNPREVVQGRILRFNHLNEAVTIFKVGQGYFTGDVNRYYDSWQPLPNPVTIEQAYFLDFS